MFAANDLFLSAIMKEIRTDSSPFDNQYHFITEWRIISDCQTIYDLLGDAQALKRWWPAVYLDVSVRKDGDENGIGKLVDLYTKGWLPYTLRWSFEVTESKKPNGFAIKAFGDLEGKGIWTFIQDGEYCRIIYDWNILGEKPLFKYFSFMLKPIFARNHYWAMKKGEVSLLLELRRMKGEKNVPPPPKPTFPHNITNNKVF
jgi:hypothetical protein